MNRSRRKAVVQISMVLTMALSAVVAIPLVNKVSQQRVEQAVKASPPGKVGGAQIFTAAIYPQVFTVFGCMVLSLVVGFMVSKGLPQAEPTLARKRVAKR